MRLLFRVVAVLFFIVAISSCKNRQTSTAKIFERKHLPENKLQIKYRYNFKGTLFTDSTIIANKILPGDTISVIVDKNDPSKSTIEKEE